VNEFVEDLDPTIAGLVGDALDNNTEVPDVEDVIGNILGTANANCAAKGGACRLFTPCCSGLICNVATRTCDLLPTPPTDVTTNDANVETPEPSDTVVTPVEANPTQPTVDPSVTDDAPIDFVTEFVEDLDPNIAGLVGDSVANATDAIPPDVEDVIGNFIENANANCAKEGSACRLLTPCCSGLFCNVATRTCAVIDTTVNDSKADENEISGPTGEPTSAPSDGAVSFAFLFLEDDPGEAPTGTPTKSPTLSPTLSPTDFPTKTPTFAPTDTPTKRPSPSPTLADTLPPTVSPTKLPTVSPTKQPKDLLHHQR